MNERVTGVIWLIMHVALGVVSSAYLMVPAVWLLVVLGAATLYGIQDRNRKGTIHLAFCYLCGYEILARESPLPWETARYCGVPLLILGIAMGKRLSSLVPGLMLLGCVLPSLLLTDYSLDVRRTLVFNWVGSLSLALSVMYFHRKVMNEKELVWILRALSGPIVSTVVMITITTPNPGDIEFTLNSGRELTGFGGNQVSTALGLGIVAIALGYCMGRPIFGFVALDLLVVVFLFYRALISFSRGGLISAIIAVCGALAVVCWALFEGKKVVREKSIRRLLAAPAVLLILVIVFIFSDNLTGGKLSLRYRGETEGTLTGEREKTMSVVTSGRWDIAKSDLLMFLDYPFFGVGVGNSSRMRGDYGYHSVATHTEFTRLLSEHGILGAAFCVFIFVYPAFVIFNPKIPTVTRATMCAFALFSLTVMMHSATRMFGTSVVYGIGWALIVPQEMMMALALRNPLLARKLKNSVNRIGSALTDQKSQ